MKRGLAILTSLTTLAALSPALAQSHRVAASGEAAATALLDRIADNPPALRLFLKAMPKGGDLHNHLGGTPYAEDYLRWAAASGLCVDESVGRIVAPPCPPERTVRQMGEQAPFAYDRLIDALSTRGVQWGVGANDVSGHSQFFASFDKLGPDSPAVESGSMIVARQVAAGDRVSYVELIHNPPAMIAAALGTPDTPLDIAGLAAFYQGRIKTIGPVIDRAIAELDANERAAAAMLDCGGKAADPGCGVAIRYLAWGWRDLPPAQAFTSLMLAFAMADRDPRYVGVNIVQPEDWVIAMRDYELHMAMIRFLAERYPRVHKTFHAGELAFGLVPPAGLKDHIRKALDAGAERIGHGTAIAYEDDAPATLARMARNHVAVEINLTSNAVILGVKGGEHPLRLYRDAGVPTMLSTDDQGILRTDMTNEYLRAVQEQRMGYADLKQMARTSLEQAFVEGPSLWADRQVGSPVRACAAGWVDPACRALVEASPKARLQMKLEEDFRSFEDRDVPALERFGGSTTK